MAARLPRCLLSKDRFLDPAGRAPQRRFVGYPEELHKWRCEAFAITKQDDREQDEVG